MNNPMSSFAGMKKPAYSGEDIKFSELLKIFCLELTSEQAEENLKDPICGHFIELTSNFGNNYIVTFEILEGGVMKAGESFALYIRSSDGAYKPSDEILKSYLRKKEKDMLRVYHFQKMKDDELTKNADKLSDLIKTIKENCEPRND